MALGYGGSVGALKAMGALEMGIPEEELKRPIKADIDHTLHNLQQVVGGYIQAIYPWDDPVALVCDEEGLLKQREFNRYIDPEVVIFGTFFICGLGEEDFADLPNDLMDKYEAMFRKPEILIATPTGCTIMPVDAVVELSDSD